MVKSEVIHIFVKKQRIGIKFTFWMFLNMTELPKMTAAKLGALWLTYHKKTMIVRILEYFIEKADDPEARDLMAGLWKQLHPKLLK